MGTPNLPLVAAIVPVRDADRETIAALVDELRSQQGVRLEIVLVDATVAGDLASPGATVVREVSPSRGLAYLRGLEVTTAPWVVWVQPGAKHDPHRVAHQVRFLEAHPDLELVTTNLAVHARRETFEQCCDQDTPPALWQGTVCLRREALTRVETTAFVPAELALYRELRERGCTGHISRGLVQVDAGLQSAATARAHEDAELLRLRAGPAHEGAPEVTVFMATYNRCETLIECLEGFSRQLVAPGTHEIVVVSDGSDDETVDVASALDLPVSLRFLHKENDGASRARIHGLPHATGRLILFVNDDTIPFADLVQRHIEAHRELDDPKAMVLGTFEQPKAHLENALMRFLEDSHFVFNYGAMRDGEPVSGAQLYTCNCSLVRAAVEEVGGFDPDFVQYSGEDTELGMRLEDAGYRLYYRAECRSFHKHFLSFEALRRRQPSVARAHTKIYSKHPQRLLGSPFFKHTRDSLRGHLRPVAPHLAALEAAAKTLASINVAKLEHLGGKMAATAQLIEERLATLFPKLNSIWWNTGLVDGFELHGISGFPEIALRCSLELPDLPGPVTLFSPDPFLATPWTEWVSAWLGGTEACGTLLVHADPERGFEVDEVKRAIAPLIQRAERDGCGAQVVIVTTPEGAEPRRLLASVDARIALPAILDEDITTFLQTAGIPATFVDPLDPNAADTPWPLSTKATRRVLAWPEWTHADSSAWMETLGELAVGENLVLVLRFDPSCDTDPGPALEALARAFAVEHPDAALEVLLETGPLGEVEWQRLRKAVDATLLLPDSEGHRRARLESLQLPTLSSREDARAWLESQGTTQTTSPQHVEALEAVHA